MAAAPSPINAGVFGMTLMTRAPFLRYSSINPVEIPAAMEMISLPLSMLPDISSSTSAIFCGFTARMMMSASLTAFLLSLVAKTPNVVLSPSICSITTSDTVTLSGAIRLRDKMPLIRALPILPPPIKLIFFPFNIFLPPVFAR
jgi:hypothetical protein